MKILIEEPSPWNIVIPLGLLLFFVTNFIFVMIIKRSYDQILPPPEERMKDVQMEVVSQFWSKYNVRNLPYVWEIIL